METLRNVLIDGYTLHMRDTGRTDRRGQSRIAYTFTAPDGTVLFDGADFSGSPMHADDSDDTVRALLGFLTLKPGDTDRDYFDAYTPAQRAWCESSACEAMQLWTLDDCEEPFTDVPPADETCVHCGTEAVATVNGTPVCSECC